MIGKSQGETEIPLELARNGKKGEKRGQPELGKKGDSLNWGKKEKRGQPELSDFSCTILPHAEAQPMCLARSSLPHYTTRCRPL